MHSKTFKNSQMYIHCTCTLFLSNWKISFFHKWNKNIFFKIFPRDRIDDQLFNLISFAWCCHFWSPICGSSHWTGSHWLLPSLPWLSLCRSCSRSERTGGCGRSHRLEERSRSRLGSHSWRTWHERYGQGSTKTEPWLKETKKSLFIYLHVCI